MPEINEKHAGPLRGLPNDHPVVRLLDEVERTIRARTVTLGFGLARACLIGLELGGNVYEPPAEDEPIVAGTAKRADPKRHPVLRWLEAIERDVLTERCTLSQAVVKACGLGRELAGGTLNPEHILQGRTETLILDPNAC